MARRDSTVAVAVASKFSVRTHPDVVHADHVLPFSGSFRWTRMHEALPVATCSSQNTRLSRTGAETHLVPLRPLHTAHRLARPVLGSVCGLGLFCTLLVHRNTSLNRGLLPCITSPRMYSKTLPFSLPLRLLGSFRYYMGYYRCSYEFVNSTIHPVYPLFLKRYKALKDAYDSRKGAKQTVTSRLALATAAAVINQCCTAPLEVVSTNVQTSGLNYRAVVRKIFRREGQ